ncbi:MAG: DUF3500 domain-containing protein [Planctomycetota bacterium]|nr:DUF3500 domain-containing protein [Planctomycetota bacterium]
MTHHDSQNCSDCGGLSRRAFVRTVGGAALAVGAGSLTGSLQAAPSAKSSAETVAAKLYGSLSDAQKKVIAFGFDHPLRKKISPNWAITKPTIGADFYTAEQRVLIDKVVRGMMSEDGYDRVMQQMEDDNGGFSEYHVALFGKPGKGGFEFELTGRHLTLRADGNSVDGAAFGGPIVYGHGLSDPKKQLYYYQTQAADKVFKSLDAKQAAAASVGKEPKETAVLLKGKTGSFPGIKVGELSKDQQKLVEATIKTVLNPYRAEDVDEAMKVLKAGGGVKSLNMAFYTAADLDNDKVWDVWRLEGPTWVSFFRGAPHVHAYINVGLKNV